MVMNRTDFEDFLSRYLWRDGDTELAADLQYLILLGETRLGRDLMVTRRQRRTTADGVAGTFPLPSDCHRLHSVSSMDRGAYRPVTSFDLADRRIRERERDPVYAILDDTVETTDPTDRTYQITYYATLPPFDLEPTWVQTEYFDLYLHACLVSATPYIREDERLAQWEQYYNITLESALRDDHYKMFASPPRARLPGVVA